MEFRSVLQEGESRVCVHDVLQNMDVDREDSISLESDQTEYLNSGADEPGTCSRGMKSSCSR